MTNFSLESFVFDVPNVCTVAQRSTICKCVIKKMIRESEERNASDDAKSNEENLILYPVMKGRLQSMIDILKSLFSFQLQFDDMRKIGRGLDCSWENSI